jgi:Na+-transporting NADH:ubiquinone oxidoreductase subunit B
MQRVLYALVPIVVSAVYLFGWRVLLMLAVCNVAGFLAEYVFTRKWGQPVSSAVFVSSSLFVLSLPPPLPLWMAVVGIVFGIVFGKMVFGGFGRNVFNPALSGRAFIYVCFGAPMTAMWADPVPGRLGGLTAYASDAITQATPGILLKTGATFPLLDLILGGSSGTIGGTNALLAVLGGLYLLWKRAANYRIVTAGLLAYLVVQGALWMAGVKGAAEPLRAALAGSFLLGIFFYATDPVSACQTDLGRWLYGAFVGAMSSVISVFSAWPAGTMFAVLLGNTLAPLTDCVIRLAKERRRGEDPRPAAAATTS